MNNRNKVKPISPLNRPKSLFYNNDQGSQPRGGLKRGKSQHPSYQDSNLQSNPTTLTRLEHPVGLECKSEVLLILQRRMECRRQMPPLRYEPQKYEYNEEDMENWMDKADYDEHLEEYDSLKHVIGKRYKVKNQALNFGQEKSSPNLKEASEKATPQLEREKEDHAQEAKEGAAAEVPHGHGHAHDPSSPEAEENENENLTEEEMIERRKKELKLRYCWTSLGQFDLEDPIRLYAISIMENPWFDRTVIILIAINSILLGIIDYTWIDDGNQTDMPLINRIVDESEIVFTLFFTFECGVKILSLGLIVNNGCYLRDGWNWLDFTVVVTALLQAIPGMGNVSAIRTFRLFRPLRSLSAIPSMKLLVNTLLNSVSQLSNILILDTFFIFTFAIFGLQMWEGVMHFRCRQTKYPENGDWLVVEGDDRICGAFHQCEIACGSLYELLLPDDVGVLTEYFVDPSIPKDRDSRSKGFNFGITNFDSIFPSFLTIFQCTTLEGWADIMALIQDGYNIYAAAIFFIICVVICNYFLINLTVAVMLDKFKNLNQANTDKVLMKYEKNSVRVQELKKINHIMELHKSISWQSRIKILYHKAIYTDPGEAPRACPSELTSENRKYDYAICRICWKMTKIPLFNTFIMTIILLNTLILATDKYPSPENDLIIQTNIFFNILFTFECAIKLLGLKFNEWKQDEFNIFDLIIVVASITEVLIISNGQAGIISVLRALRLIRLIKLARSNVTLRCLIDSIAATVKAIGNFMVIMAIFIYVFSLLGMQIFAGKFKFDKEGQFDPINGSVPRTNFDGLLWSIVTVFQIMVGDNWNQVMYKAYLSVSPRASAFFIILVLLGKIILLNLFLAILLGNFEQESLIIRGMMEDQILEKFELQNRHMQKIKLKLDSEVHQKFTQKKESQQSEIEADRYQGESSPEQLFNLQKVNVSSKETNELQIPQIQKIDSRIPGVEVTVVDFEEEKEEEKAYKDSSFDSSVEEAQASQEAKNKGQSGLLFQRSQTQFESKNKNFDEIISPADQTPHPRTQNVFHLNQNNTIQSMDEVRNKKDLLGQPSGEVVEEDLNEQMDTNRQLMPKSENVDKEQNEHVKIQLMGRSKTQQQIFSKPIIDTKLGRENLGDVELCEEDESMCSGHGHGEESEQDLGDKSKVLKFMSQSSLFIFHQDSCFRKFMIGLTTAPIVKSVTQKDILLSQIQNGGELDDETDDEQEFDDQEAKIKGGADLLPLGIPIQSRQKKERLLTQQNQQLQSPGPTPMMLQNHDNTSSVLKTSDKIQEEKDGKPEEANESPKHPNAMLDDSTASAIEEINKIKKMKEGSIIKRLYENQDTLRKNQIIQGIVSIKKCKRKIICWRWTLNNWFEYTIYSMIGLSMIMLILQNPMNDPEGIVTQKLQSIDRTITIIFIVEAVCRIIALGFFNSSIPQRKAYIKSGGNQIDFFVCIGCDLILIYNNHNEDTVALSPKALQSFKVLRALKALRPLRVISKNQGLKLAVGSLFGALPAIANGMIVCLLIVFIYAIAGVNLFKGKFFRCLLKDQDQFDDIEASITTKQDCFDIGGEWINSQNNFDNIFSSSAVLFQIITTEGWLDVMYMGIDAVGVDMQPKKNQSPLLSLYFISFIIVGNIFVLNLFVGIVIDKFNRLKDRMCGYALMTRDQKEWIESEKQMIRLQLVRKKNPPSNPNQLLAYKIAKHKYFDIFINICILISTIILALRYYQMSDDYLKTLENLSYILTFIYNFEAIVKITAFQMDYFEQNWNRFDFFIVIIADISILIQLLASEGQQGVITIMTIIKAVRILRVFRLIRTSRKLRVLVDSLLVILPSIANVGSLMMLMFFIFAVIGMNMFSGIIHQDYINQNSNFMNFGMSLVVLIRCATGENWNLIMKELAINNESYELFNLIEGEEEQLGCVETQTYQSLINDGPRECGTALSFFYFALFIIVIQMMMLNLFIAVVLEGYASTNKMHQGAVKSDDYEILLEKWVDYDNQATGWIDVHDLIFLIYELNEPLGRLSEYESDIKDQLDMTDGEKNDENIIDQSKRYVVHMEKNMIIPFKRALYLLNKIQLPVYGEFSGDHKCHFRDVCKRLTRFALEKINPDYDPSGIEYKHLKVLSRAWIEKYPDLKTKKIKRQYDTGKLWASLFIASCIKNVVSLRRLKRQKTETNNNKKDNFQIKKSQKPASKNESEASDRNSHQNSSQMKDRTSLSQNDPPSLDIQKTQNVPFYDKMKEEFPGNNQQLENYVEIIQHCDFQIQKLKKAKELQKMEKHEKVMMKKRDNISQKLVSNFKEKQLLAKLRMEKELAKDQRGKPDFDRSTWWLENEQQNQKMLQWVNKQNQNKDNKK